MDVFFSCVHDNRSYKERLYGQLRLISSERSCQNSPLLQIGAEFDEDCNLQSIKYYINIDNTAMDCKNNFWSKYEFGREHQIICENGYKPIFVGINDIDGIEEHKLYFISKALGFKNTKILDWTEKLAISLGWDQMIAFNEFRQLYDMGLFAEGIAFSVHRKGVWRLYFREFTKRRYGTHSELQG